MRMNITVQSITEDMKSASVKDLLVVSPVRGCPEINGFLLFYVFTVFLHLQALSCPRTENIALSLSEAMLFLFMIIHFWMLHWIQ